MEDDEDREGDFTYDKDLFLGEEGAGLMDTENIVSGGRDDVKEV